jgi:two-component system response regulator QseB
MRLLLVEDNDRISTMVCEGLRGRGFTTDTAATLATADDLLHLTLYDAVILDLGMPDGDGLHWLRTRRAFTRIPPVLILTARSALGDRIEGLDAGADDYLIKPFSVEEVAARMRALLRRPGPRQQTVLWTGDLRFDAATRSASFRESALSLTRREADVLELLMRRAGSVTSKEAIENAIYTINEAVTPNAVEVLVSRLRRKLSNAGGGSLLHTVRGVGYLISEFPRV